MSSTVGDSGVPRIEVGDAIERGFDWVQEHLGDFFDQVADLIEVSVDTLSDVLNSPPMLLMAALLALLAWGAGNWKLAFGSMVGLVSIIAMDQWPNAMQTLALVFVAALVSLVIGIPIGILAARCERVSRAVRPVLDLMQTMPAFVWLVPAVTLFSLGVSAGLVATVIFALPPGVRLTELGIRQVDREVVEAGHAFGGTPRQILGGIQLPLALPTVMAGVNQVIMLALSMAVIAGLVGAGGLGSAVTTSIARLDIGLGFEAGLSVVILAIYLDRVTAAIGDRGPGRSGVLSLLRGRRRADTGTGDTDVSGEGSSDPAPTQEAHSPVGQSA